jgi:hypothetical protein
MVVKNKPFAILINIALNLIDLLLANSRFTIDFK